MIRTILCFAFSVCISFASYSQKKTRPDAKDELFANTLKEVYPDAKITIENSTERISFAQNKKDKKVKVIQNQEETLMNIDSRVNIQQYTFYDGESEIDEFIIKYKNNKKTDFYVRDEAYTSNDLFHNDTRVKYVSLDFPVKGYKYLSEIRKTYRDIKYFTSVYFTGKYPIVNKTIEINVPDWLNLELKEINFEGYTINKEILDNEKVGSKTYRYTLENIPAMDKESNTPGPTYIYPHLLVLPKSFTMNDEKQVLFESTQDLYNWYSSLTKSLKNEEKPFSDKVKELTMNASSEDEKVKNIYYWVQDNIRYIAFEDGIAGFKPDEAANVYKKKYGDCKGMANLMKEMLIEAGFDARLTWIGTKRIAYDYSTPNLSVDNHMICTLFKDGQTIFLDGTEKFNAYGEYADRIQSKQVMIENGDEFIIKTVPEITPEFNKEIINYNLNLESDRIVGNAHKLFKGESRSSILYYFDSLKNDKKDEFLETYLSNGNSDIKVSNIETSDLLNRDIDLDMSYDLEVSNSVSSFDGSIYIDLDFDKEFEGFFIEDRKTDYVFSSKKALESVTTLQIPNGYKVSDLPKNINTDSKNYQLKLEFSKENNTITYKKNFVIKNAKIETADFQEWNEFITKLKAIYNEQIILTKQ